MSLSVEAVAYRDGDGTGDPNEHCEDFRLSATGRVDAQLLARFNRNRDVLEDREAFRRLLDLMEYVKAERSEAVALVGC